MCSAVEEPNLLALANSVPSSLTMDTLHAVPASSHSTLRLPNFTTLRGTPTPNVSFQEMIDPMLASGSTTKFAATIVDLI